MARTAKKKLPARAKKVTGTIDRKETNARLDQLTSKYLKESRERERPRFSATYFEGVAAGLKLAGQVVDGTEDDDNNPLMT
jgi:hypothetical protein